MDGHRMAIGSALDVVHLAFNAAVDVMEAGRASLLLLDITEPILRVSASVGVPPAIVPSIGVPIGHGIAGTVVDRGLPLFGVVDGQTFISTPVTTEQGVEGVLNLTNRRGNKQYTTADLPAAASFAGLVGHLLTYTRRVSRDAVSGLLNRQAFEEMLERELARSERTKSPFAVVFLDVDHLKAINDRSGHATGDAVLRGIGEALQGLLRSYDVAGRYGGDEFALLLAGSSGEPGGIMERIAEAEAQVAARLQVELSMSAGVAYYPADGISADELMSTADRRMYAQKREKRSFGG